MFEKEQLKKAIRWMCAKNPDWAEILHYAPGAAALRFGVAFYGAMILEKPEDQMSDEEKKSAQQFKDEYREFRENLEPQLNAFELKYLAEQFDRMGKAEASKHYRELLSQKQELEQAEAQSQYDDLMARIRAEKETSGDGGSDTPSDRPYQGFDGGKAPQNGENSAAPQAGGQEGN